ncbi:MAG: hypothetical protein RSA48_00100 [Bacilli bacterium]
MSLDGIILQRELDALTGSLLEEVTAEFLTFKMFEEAYLISEDISFCSKIALSKATEDPVGLLISNYETWVDEELKAWYKNPSNRYIKEYPELLLKYKLVELLTFLDQGRQLGIKTEAYGHTNLRRVFDRAYITKLMLGRDPVLLFESPFYPDSENRKNYKERLDSTEFEILASYIVDKFNDDCLTTRTDGMKSIYVAADKAVEAKELIHKVRTLCLATTIEKNDCQYMSFRNIKINEDLPTAFFRQSRDLFKRGISHNIHQNKRGIILVIPKNRNKNSDKSKSPRELVKNYK